MAMTVIRSMQKKGYLLLDAFFAVGAVFSIIRQGGNDDIHIVTRAKKNVTAYMPAPRRRKKKRGRRPMYGKKLKLMKLFDSHRQPFATVRAEIYGSTEVVKYMTLNLLWKPMKGVLRFILVESSHGRIILMTTDLSLSVETALYLYCKRTSIETLFNSLKNLLGALGYHFWSKYLSPSSRRPLKKNTPKPASTRPVKTKQTFEAIEKFVAVQCVVLGMLQLIALKLQQEIVCRAHCWLRTPPPEVPSEFITKMALTNILQRNIAVFAKSMIPHIIRTKREIHEKSKCFMKVA